MGDKFRSRPGTPDREAAPVSLEQGRLQRLRDEAARETSRFRCVVSCEARASIDSVLHSLHSEELKADVPKLMFLAQSKQEKEQTFYLTFRSYKEREASKKPPRLDFYLDQLARYLSHKSFGSPDESIWKIVQCTPEDLRPFFPEVTCERLADGYQQKFLLKLVFAGLR